MTSSVSAVPQTRVRVVNELLGTERSYTVPAEPAEVDSENLDIALAHIWLFDAAVFEANGIDYSLAVAVRKAGDTIQVRWFVLDDPEQARYEWETLLRQRRRASR